jgi:hypothetical protein
MKQDVLFFFLCVSNETVFPNKAVSFLDLIEIA